MFPSCPFSFTVRCLVRHNILRISAALLALVVSAGCSKEARLKRYLVRADADFQTGRFDRAEIEYLNILKLSPRQSSAIARLGIIYQIQGKSPAFGLLLKASELDPANLEVRTKLGLLYSEAHQPKQARETALAVLDRQPENEEALLLLCDSVQSSEEMEQAQRLIEGFRQRNPNQAASFMALGALHFREQDFDKAQAELNQAVTLNPKSAGAQLVLGNILLAKGDLARAEASLKQAADLSPWRSPKRLGFAEFKWKTGAADEAWRLVEEMTRKVPDYLLAWSFLARLAGAERKFEQCDAFIDRILGQDPRNYGALLLKANLLIGRGDGTNAVAHLERVSTIYKSNPEVLGQLAVAHLMNLDVAKARSSLTQALAANPQFADAILLLAELDIRQNKTGSAIAAIKRLIERQPQLARAHFLLADAYAAQKEPDEAIAVYRRMLQLFPDNPQVPLLLGMHLGQQNRISEARQAFEKSQELAPNSISAFEQLVNLDLAEKNYAAAAVRVQKRHEKEPQSANPWLLFAKIHLAEGDRDQAETELLKAVALEPQLRNPYLLLADLYRTSNKETQALEKLTALVARSTNDLAALLQIGMLQEARTNYPAARDAYERILSMNRNSNPALNNLACLYGEHLGHLDHAYDLASRARLLYPNDPYTADTLGWILYQQGDYVHALGSLQQSARLLPAEPDVQFHLGMACYMMGDEEEARARLTRVLQSTNNFAGRELAAQALETLSIDSKTADPQAVAALESKHRTRPRDPMVLSKLGAIEVERSNFKEALAYYQSARQQNPKNPHVLMRLAQLYGNHLGDTAKAMQLAREAHNLASEDPYVSYTLGHFTYLTGDYEWALSLTKEAAAKLPADPYVQYDLALCHYAMGETESAMTAMNTAVQLNIPFLLSAQAKTFLRLVNAVQDRKMALEAITEATDLLRTDPKNIPALMVLARANENVDARESRRTYENILTIAPSFAPAGKSLAIMIANHVDVSGNLRNARNVALKVRERYPDDPELARALGILSCRVATTRSDFLRSAQLLQRATNEGKGDAVAFYFLGKAQYGAKQLDESKKALEQAIQLSLDDKLAADARQMLAALK